MVTIRLERPDEQDTVRQVVGRAFGRELEMCLLDRLRQSPGYLPELSLVAEEGGDLVGHVLLTRVPVLLPERGAAEVMMLSPLAVHPEAQGRGIGRALVDAAADAAEARGDAVILLEGDPAFYRRLGFEPASAYGIEPPSTRIPEHVFQARTLSAYEPGMRGAMLYPAAVWELGAVGPHD
ncbi:MAG: GNAT family N-acetyltransferase [Streptosporangiales bacterium]